MSAHTSAPVRRGTELLLVDDVPNLGKRGEIVRAKPGFARNYLLPQGLAVVANEHHKKMVQQHIVRLEEIQKQKIGKLRSLADGVSKYSVTLEANVNEEGHLYGSIGANDISRSLRTAGFDVTPENVRLDGPIKEAGLFTVRIHFHPEVECDVKVWVVPTGNT